MRELTDEEKRTIEDNIVYLGEEYKAFYNDYIAVNKELGFRCNSVETYDYQDRWVSEIKIKNVFVVTILLPTNLKIFMILLNIENFC